MSYRTIPTHHGRPLRPIHADSEANDGPGQAEQDRLYAVSLARTNAKRAAEAADNEAARISSEMFAARAVRVAQAMARPAAPVSVAWSDLTPAEKRAEEPDARSTGSGTRRFSPARSPNGTRSVSSSSRPKGTRWPRRRRPLAKPTAVTSGWPSKRSNGRSA